MFVTFATVYGTTVSQTLFVRTLLNYSATEAGIILAPGAMATMH